MQPMPCNKIETIPQADELLQVIDLAREGHYPSKELLRVFFLNLQAILGPFSNDIFVAAEIFVSTME